MRDFHKNWLTAEGQFQFPTRKTGETDRKKMKRSISKLKLDTHHCKTGNRNGNILS